MSVRILLLGLAILAAGACSYGCKGAEADLFSLDAGAGSSGGGGTQSSLTPGTSSGGTDPSGSSSGASSGGDDGAPTGDDAPTPDATNGMPEAAAADAALDGSTLEASAAGDDAGRPDDALAPSLDAPAASDAASSADGLVCANLGCFDFPDCVIFHGAQVGPCGFTKCVNLVCQ
ncbi:MAG: hypothetical protein ACRENE_34715 [Polyangiaceae bacterium]